jgi:hypothetical protein
MSTENTLYYLRPWPQPPLPPQPPPRTLTPQPPHQTRSYSHTRPPNRVSQHNTEIFRQQALIDKNSTIIQQQLNNISKNNEKLAEINHQIYEQRAIADAEQKNHKEVFDTNLALIQQQIQQAYSFYGELTIYQQNLVAVQQQIEAGNNTLKDLETKIHELTEQYKYQMTMLQAYNALLAHQAQQEMHQTQTQTQTQT